MIEVKRVGERVYYFEGFGDLSRKVGGWNIFVVCRGKVGRDNSFFIS